MLVLKKCPMCGRRFGVRLAGKVLVEDRRDAEEKRITVLVPGGYGRNTGNPMRSNSIVATETKTYEISYECGYCGHRWMQRETKLRRS